MFLFDWFMDKVTITDPSEFESYYEDVSYKTFIIDESIWNHLKHKRPDIGYYRKLQVCYTQLREELSNSLLYDTTELIDMVRQYHTDNMELEKQLTLALARVEVLEEQLQSARQYQTQAGRKQEIGLETSAANDQERDISNRFTNSDGITTIQKQKLAFVLSDNGYGYDEIANTLNISIGSARSYISTARQNCDVRKFADGSKVYGWQGKYNSLEHDISGFKIAHKIPLNDVKKPLNNPLNEPFNNVLKAI